MSQRGWHEPRPRGPRRTPSLIDSLDTLIKKSPCTATAAPPPPGAVGFTEPRRNDLLGYQSQRGNKHGSLTINTEQVIVHSEV